jgi:hypothetical protein
MSRLLVVEITDGEVSAVSVDTGVELNLSVAVVNHNEKMIYRIGEAEQGAEEIIALCKAKTCIDFTNKITLNCTKHQYQDEDDGVEL